MSSGRTDVIVIDGHPNSNSLCAALAKAYAEAAGAQIIKLRELSFDPILRQRDQTLEPELLQARQAIEQAHHVVFVSPTWWSAPSALLKGFIDRVFLAGWAYKYQSGSLLPKKLLAGRSGRIILTADSPRIWLALTGNLASRMLRKQVLQFSGITPTKATLYCSVRTSTPEKRQRWLNKIAEIGAADAARVRKKTAQK